MQVIRWQEAAPPQEQELRNRLQESCSTLKRVEKGLWLQRPRLRQKYTHQILIGQVEMTSVIYSDNFKPPYD